MIFLSKEDITYPIGHTRPDHVGDDVPQLEIPERDIVLLHILHDDAECHSDRKYQEKPL